MIEVSFNGTVLTRQFEVGNIRRPMAGNVSSSTKVDGADGELFDGIVRGRREVSFTVLAARGSDRELHDAAAVLAAVFAVRKPAPLTFSDERDSIGTQKVRYAVPDGAFDADTFKALGKWECRFVMHDPYLYGKQRSVVLKTNQAQKIQVGGNAETFPVAVSTPSGSVYTLGIENGQGIIFRAPFSGQELTVDFKRERIMCKPAISGADGIQTRSRFFAMKDTMTLVASAQTTLTWTELWL